MENATATCSQAAGEFCLSFFFGRNDSLGSWSVRNDSSQFAQHERTREGVGSEIQWPETIEISGPSRFNTPSSET